jgi:hypothetical protein
MPLPKIDTGPYSVTTLNEVASILERRAAKLLSRLVQAEVQSMHEYSDTDAAERYQKAANEFRSRARDRTAASR